MATAFVLINCDLGYETEIIDEIKQFEDIVNYEGKSEWIEIGSDRILYYLADHQDQIDTIDVLSSF